MPRGKCSGIAQETAQKSAGHENVSKGLSQLKDAARTGKAIVRAAVGLLGGAGGLIALVLVTGAGAAVIGTPFGVFWSGQDAGAQSRAAGRGDYQYGVYGQNQSDSGGVSCGQRNDPPRPGGGEGPLHHELDEYCCRVRGENGGSRWMPPMW